MTPTDMQNELANLKASYQHNLDDLGRKVREATAMLGRNRVSSHDPFNMSATTQELAVLAGKIAQTENVIRWMAEAR